LKPPLAPVATPEPASPRPWLFQSLMKPFIAEGLRARAERASDDPRYSHRVEKALNADRVNFLLFGYGETHEPPRTERQFIGSYTILSYAYDTGKIQLVSLTHDIRAPEIERYLRVRGEQTPGPIKLDRAFAIGGFDLMRQTLEDATGLSMDFQMALEEAAFGALTDEVFQGITVDVPMDFTVNPFYLDGKKYPEGTFTRGLHILDGTRVLQFIKTVPVEQVYDKSLEHNARKHLIVKSMMDTFADRSDDMLFWWRALQFLNKEAGSRSVAYDFDVKSLLINNVNEILGTVHMALATGKSTASAMPEIDRTIYIVDPGSGDGGVQWVLENAQVNPVTRKDVESGTYTDIATEVPYNGDPHAEDLVTRYWADLRAVVAARLREPVP
jgi:LytR_cpsA_psr family